jgi:hypothetical protein
MTVLDQKRLKRRDELKHHFVDIADNQRTIIQPQGRHVRPRECVIIGVSPAPPSAWKARVTDSGFVSLAAQKSISVGSWFIKNPRTPCQKIRAPAPHRARLLCFKPCQSQEAAHQFRLSGKPYQDRDCGIFRVFHSLSLILSNSGIRANCETSDYHFFNLMKLSLS